MKGGNAIVFSQDHRQCKSTRYKYHAGREEFTLKTPYCRVMVREEHWNGVKRRMELGERVLLQHVKKPTGDAILPVKITKEVPDEEGYTDYVDEDSMREVRNHVISTQKLSKTTFDRILEAATPVLAMALFVGVIVLILYFAGDLSVDRAAAITGQVKSNAILNATKGLVAGG